MTTPYPVDPSGIQAALARRLGVTLPNGQVPFDPLQFSLSPHIYASQDDNGNSAEQAAMQQRQYMQNMQMFNKPSNSNRKKSQNAQSADTSASVIY